MYLRHELVFPGRNKHSLHANTFDRAMSAGFMISAHTYIINLVIIVLSNMLVWKVLCFNAHIV